MKKFLTVLLISTSIIISATTPSLEKYIDNMRRACDYMGSARYSVLLPQAEDPVTFNIDMISTVVPGDTLAPCRYLVSWKRGNNNEIDGFTAYMNGSHYRYRDNRLQEYHMQWDSIPFLIKGGGVQGTAQFVDVLPQFMGRDLAAMVCDTNFVYKFTPDTLYRGQNVSVLKGKQLYHGYTGKEVTYVFNPVTGMPVSVEYENNPGAISEQTVTINFNMLPSRPFTIDSEEQLVEMFPDVFERFRESNFRVENLPGTPLPTFSAPTLDNQRYTYHRGDPLKKTTVILVIDDAISNPGQTLDALSHAHETSPVDFNTVIAFVSNHSDRATEIMDGHDVDNVIIGARTLARDCGITLYPTILYVGQDGIVKDITLGYNKDLSNVVIQKIMMIK